MSTCLVNEYLPLEQEAKRRSCRRSVDKQVPVWCSICIEYKIQNYIHPSRLRAVFFSLSQNPRRNPRGGMPSRPLSVPATAISKDLVTSGHTGWLCSKYDKVQRTPDSFSSPCLPLRTKLHGVIQRQVTSQGPGLEEGMSSLVLSRPQSPNSAMSQRSHLL